MPRIDSSRSWKDTDFLRPIGLPSARHPFKWGQTGQVECDVTTTCVEFIQKIHELFGVHPSSFSLVCDGSPIIRKSFVLEKKKGSWKIVKMISVQLPSDVPTVYSPIDFAIPPKHSDVFVPAPVCSIRLAARHPVWSTFERYQSPWMQLLAWH